MYYATLLSVNKRLRIYPLNLEQFLIMIQNIKFKIIHLSNHHQQHPLKKLTSYFPVVCT